MLFQPLSPSFGSPGELVKSLLIHTRFVFFQDPEQGPRTKPQLPKCNHGPKVCKQPARKNAPKIPALNIAFTVSKQQSTNATQRPRSSFTRRKAQAPACCTPKRVDWFLFSEGAMAVLYITGYDVAAHATRPKTATAARTRRVMHWQ